jgi:cellulose synthase/poly-beta-1,6-N-acetylglucosamine synthase-like glycosyltransferase
MPYSEQLRQLFEIIFQFYEKIGDNIFNIYLQYSRPFLDVLHITFDSIFYVLLYVTIALTSSYLLMSIYLLFFKNKYKEKIAKEKDLPFVTIQIPTYNELAALNCAKRCLDFDYPKSKYEILIGDDSSDKSISKKINLFAKNYKRVKVTRRGGNAGFKPGNLNHMLKFTKGEYIVIFDSDFLPEKDFLKRIISPFVFDKKLHATQARWVTKNFSQNLASIVGGTIPFFTHQLGLPVLNRMDSISFIAGSAEAVKTSTLKSLGGWQSGSLTEDIEYSLRLTKEGKKIIYLENLLCECEAPYTVKDLAKQQMRWAYGVITAGKEHLFGIISNRKIKASKKMNIFILLSGYIMTVLFFLLAVTGFLSIITHRPGLIDWNRFISETTLNIILTSGFLLTTSITYVLGKKTKEIPRMLLASFSIGIIVINIITIGIFKALFNRPMQWFMLNKRGNEVSV